MDLGQATGKYPPIPSRGSSEGGLGSRPPIPYHPQSGLNSGRGTPSRDEDNQPPPESKARPEPTPPLLRSCSSHSHITPVPFPANTPSRTKCIPTNSGQEPQTKVVTTNLVDLYRYPGSTQHGQDGQRDETTAYNRQKTFTEQDSQQDPYYRQDQGGQQDPHYRQEKSDQQNPYYRQGTGGQQDPYYQQNNGQQTEFMTTQEPKSREMKTQRSTQKGHLKHQQKATTSTGRPEWKITSRNSCKLPGVYPEPFKPLPPVPKYTSGPPSVRPSEARMTRPEHEMNAKQSQISARSNAGPSAKPTKSTTKPGHTSARPSSSADFQPLNKTRRTSQISTNDIPDPNQEDPKVTQSSLRLQPFQDSSDSFGAGSFQFGSEDRILTGVPLRRSSERLNVEKPVVGKVPSGMAQSILGPIEFNDENIRFDAEYTDYSKDYDIPSKPSTERIREECANLMQKLTTELALTKNLPSTENLCVRLSVSEQITSDGRRRSFTICEPSFKLTNELAQEECSEVYATPSAPSPRGSMPKDTPKPRVSIRETIEEVSDTDTEIRVEKPEPPLEQEVTHPPRVTGTFSTELILPPTMKEVSPPQDLPPSPKCESDLPDDIDLQEETPQCHVERVPATTEIVPLKDVVTVAPSIQEILPPLSSSRLSAAQVEDIFISRPPQPTLPESAQPVRSPLTEPAAKPGGSRKEPLVSLDRESTTGIKFKTAENEALNTEFLYYSSALKNLLPGLSYPEDRCRLVPWVKKLFSPEYCARLLRDKRNRFLLHLSVVLCNDEVIGVFRNPPPEGTIPSVDELCFTRYPPAAWECDSAWLDNLEDIPPGVARMPCPWHPSGCPESSEQPAESEGSCPDICNPWRQYGTSSELSIGWSLDQEFKLLLYLSRPLKPLMKWSKDRQRMVSWLRYLCTVTPDCCIALRSRRNDYIKLLLAYGHDDRMTGPFAKEPVWGLALPSLGDQGDGTQARPFADPASGDVDEFLRSVPVPNEGAFCYVAVDGIPVTPITRPSASASLLQR